MPSAKNPALVVHPGSGRLPSGVLTASAFLFPGSGGGGSGGGADVQAHIANPTDAHMAGAIGIPATDPQTGMPLLAQVGGPIDGESVLDFISSVVDLFPVRPPSIGMVGVPNTGEISWSAIRAKAAYTYGLQVHPANNVVSNATALLDMAGMIFPADRGVLALYYSSDNDFFHTATTSLLAYVWLGSDPAPAGIPSAAFLESLRTTGQAPFAAPPNSFDLLDRFPYLEDYSSQGSPYVAYKDNFYSYQLAKYNNSTSASIPLAVSGGSYLLVHWRPSYALSLTDVQTLNATTLVPSNCFSDTNPNFSQNTTVLYDVYRDPGAASPTLNTLNTSVAGGTTSYLSGIAHYDNATPFEVSIHLVVNDLFNGSYYLGSVANANIPVGKETLDPVSISRNGFQLGTVPVGYYLLGLQGSGTTYTIGNAPNLADTSELNYVLSFVGTTPLTPSAGKGSLAFTLRRPFTPDVAVSDTSEYLYNSFLQNPSSTETFEGFDDEQFRVISNGDNPLVSISPGYPSAQVLVVNDGLAQVIGSSLVYPTEDYSACVPSGANYNLADAANHVRQYVRAFNTGTPRNTGRLRLRGLAQSAFLSPNAFTGNLVSDHPGGACIQIKVPGATGWLDVGRYKGNPNLTTTDGHGCLTGIVVSGTDLLLAYDTTSYTSDNGAGKFLLFIRVSWINGSGTGLSLDAVEWLNP